jgi:hypothetical protein
VTFLPQYKRKLPVPQGLALLVVGLILGTVLLYITSTISQTIVQALLFLISMIIIWYVAHPLSHYFIARIFSVDTQFFFIAPSDIGKSGPALARKVSPILLTIGTKLDHSRLETVSKIRRAWIFGAGALIGIIILALIESMAILSFRFNVISLVLGGLFFLVTIGTELGLSTKSGDLSKMIRELAKPK